MSRAELSRRRKLSEGVRAKRAEVEASAIIAEARVKAKMKEEEGKKHL